VGRGPATPSPRPPSAPLKRRCVFENDNRKNDDAPEDPRETETDPDDPFDRGGGFRLLGNVRCCGVVRAVVTLEDKWRAVYLVRERSFSKQFILVPADLKDAISRGDLITAECEIYIDDGAVSFVLMKSLERRGRQILDPFPSAFMPTEWSSEPGGNPLPNVPPRRWP